LQESITYRFDTAGDHAEHLSPTLVASGLMV